MTLPGDGTGDLLAQADTLDDGGPRRADARVRRRSTSIGYSAGGVVARLWVDRHDGASVARRIVTLGSPLHGARLAGAGAALAPDACPAGLPAARARQRRCSTRSTTQTLPDGLPWLSVWTENDETVQPPDSARLDGAVNVSMQSLCPQARVSHSAAAHRPAGDRPGAGRRSAPAPLAAPTACPALRPA